MTVRKQSLAMGVDIGGTKLAAGVVDGSGAILQQIRTPMAAKGEASAGLAAVTSAITALGKKLGAGASLSEVVSGIGLCSPGPVDPHTGVVINPPNLPCWRNYPLVAEVGRVFGVPVKLDNDGNAAALAEAQWGAGRGFQNVFYATIGTGIGTGIVFDGRIYHGRTGAAAEGGHVSIDYRGPRCGCGKPGCIEVLACGPAIARRARAKLSAGQTSALLDLAKGNAEAITPEMVGQAYAAGDAVARETLLETVDLLALWLGNMVDLLEPDVMVMGGGVAAMLQPLFDEIRERLPGCCINSRCQEIPLVMARYGADAGIAGGAALCSAAATSAV
ncbi:MAG TPA: ROK family protein [Terriglobales bacterium]|nr:ROK family protein [Terriglobales bacterium]